MPDRETQSINQNITVKGNPVKHYEDFILNDRTIFNNLIQTSENKIDKFSLFYIAVSLFSGITVFIIHYSKSVIPKNSFTLFFLAVYLIGVFIHAMINKLTADKMKYSYLNTVTRDYFLSKYNFSDEVNDVYSKQKQFLQTAAKKFVNISCFYLLHFFTGIAFIFFILQNFISLGSPELSLTLSIIINLFLSYIFYFWYKTGIESFEEESKNE